MLTEEEWAKKESKDGQLLLTRDEWLKRSNRGGTEGFQGTRYRGRGSNRGGRDRSKVRCFICNTYGHYGVECKSRRDKEKSPEANLVQAHDDDEPALLLAKCGEKVDDIILLNKETIPKLSAHDAISRESNVWYLDNGASNHMTGQRSKFASLDEGIQGQVKFGDGSLVEIKGKRSIMLQCKNGEERVLNEVYYIPTLCNNIISLGQLSEEGNKVMLSGDFLWVRDRQEKLLMKVKRSANRLYKIIIETNKPACFLSKVEEKTWMWHTRLGHVNFHAMMLMNVNEMVHGLPRFIQPKEACTGCLMTKQVRKPFPHQTNFKASKGLESIHGNLCGPISPATTAGNR